MAEIKAPRELLPPGSEQILRVDRRPDGDLVITLVAPALESPASWGIVLVDIAHHVADAGEKFGFTREESLALVWEFFNTEWENRTDRTRPHHGPRGS